MVKVGTKVKNLFTEIVGEEREKCFDENILNYLLNILEAQTIAGTATDLKEVQDILSLFFLETNCCLNKKDSAELTSTLINKMKTDGLIKELEENEMANQPVKLKEAINLGKEYDVNVRRSNFYASNSIVNTNSEIDWEEKKNMAKIERKQKREEKARAAEVSEYEEYLRMRGIAKAKGLIKIHNSDYGGSRDIHCENFSISVGNKTLLEDSDLHLAYGRRYGLIGRNGAGKTTLLRHMADRELDGLPPYLQIVHIEQEVTGDDTTALDCVLKTDIERTQLLEEEIRLLESNDTASAKRLGEVYQRMEEIDAHSAESKASAILSGLGFDQDMQHTKTKQFSGGWRMRVALARALFISPDILLLDEPTNHLDLHAVLWLENYLNSYTKTLIIVSHARTFLNNTATDIIHLHDRKLVTYKGDYDTFERTRGDKLKNQQKLYESQQMQKKHIQSFIDRFRYKAATAKMAQSRIKMLERMNFVDEVEDDPTFSFKIPSPEEVSPPYLQAIDVSFWYKPEKVLFTDLNFNLDMDSRIALVGDNGAGKTTFLQVLTGELQPTSGIVQRNPKIKIAKFSQHHVDQLNLQQTGLEYMLTKFPNADSQSMRAHLGSLGMTGELALQPIYTLSGGQKSRIAFALLTYTKPHLLLLDEPTNHLDIDTVEALIQALNEYGGGFLIVSHDEHLISSVCDEIWVCGDQRIQKFDGDFADFKRGITVNY